MIDYKTGESVDASSAFIYVKFCRQSSAKSIQNIPCHDRTNQFFTGTTVILQRELFKNTRSNSGAGCLRKKWLQRTLGSKVNR